MAVEPEDRSVKSLTWFRVENNVVDHPKTFHLQRILKNPTAGWYVVRLWSWTMRFAPSGVIPAGAESELEAVCRWTGTPSILIRALLEVGFLVRLEDGSLEVHDWPEHQGVAVSRAQKEADRKKTARAAAQDKLRAVRGRGAETAQDRRTNGAPTDGTDGTDGTRRDVKHLRDPEKPGPADVDGSPPIVNDGQPTKKPPKPRESDLLCADFLEVTGEKYAWKGAKDGVAFAELKKLATLDEIRERWRMGLQATGWNHTPTVAQLCAKWNELSALKNGIGVQSIVKNRNWRAEQKFDGPIKVNEDGSHELDWGV